MRWSNPGYAQAMIWEEAKRRGRIKAMKQPIKEVEKSWGYELWIINTPLYCGKELMVRRGKWSSKGNYHYHLIKDETFYILKGNLILDFVDSKEIFHSITLRPGEAFRVPPTMKHRFSTNTFGGCKFIEFSTKHRDSDSYRCHYSKGGNWIDA